MKRAVFLGVLLGAALASNLAAAAPCTCDDLEALENALDDNWVKMQTYRDLAARNVPPGPEQDEAVGRAVNRNNGVDPSSAPPIKQGSGADDSPPDPGAAYKGGGIKWGLTGCKPDLSDQLQGKCDGLRNATYAHEARHCRNRELAIAAFIYALPLAVSAGLASLPALGWINATDEVSAHEVNEKALRDVLDPLERKCRNAGWQGTITYTQELDLMRLAGPSTDPAVTTTGESRENSYVMIRVDTGSRAGNRSRVTKRTIQDLLTKTRILESCARGPTVVEITRVRNDTKKTSFLAVGTPTPVVHISDPKPGPYRVTVVVPEVGGEGFYSESQFNTGACYPSSPYRNAYPFDSAGVEIRFEFDSVSDGKNIHKRSGSGPDPAGATITWDLTWTE